MTSFEYEIHDISGGHPGTIGYADGNRLRLNLQRKLQEIEARGWDVFTVNIADESTSFIVARRAIPEEASWTGHCWCGDVVIAISDGVGLDHPLAKDVEREWCRAHAPRCRSGAHFKGNCRCRGDAKGSLSRSPRYAAIMHAMVRSDALDMATLTCCCGEAYHWCGFDPQLYPWLDKHADHKRPAITPAPASATGEESSLGGHFGETTSGKEDQS